MMEEFWKKCRDVILIPRLHLKNPPSSRKMIPLLTGDTLTLLPVSLCLSDDLLLLSSPLLPPLLVDLLAFNLENSLPVVAILDKIVLRVLVQEILVNWQPCCVLLLRQIIDSNKLPLSSKRLSTLIPSIPVPSGALCNICRRESGNELEALPVFFDLNQTQESVKISPWNALLDATLQFIVSPDSNLIGIGAYVKEQFQNLLHHQSNIQLTVPEQDCLLNSILHLYGSSVTGLQVSCVESDIDLMIEPPSTVRVPQSSIQRNVATPAGDSDVEEEDESESGSEMESEDEDEEEGTNINIERRNRVTQIANREMKEILNQLIGKEEKARKKNPKNQRSDQFLEFLILGRETIQRYEIELKEQKDSLKLVETSVVEINQATEQISMTSENLLPEVHLLKVIEKYIRKLGSKYGFTLKSRLHHIRVPLLSVQVSLPRTLLPSLPDSDLNSLPPWISCDITLYKYHPLRNTAFICAYLNWDQTNKLKSLMLLVKRFVQVNEIHGASHGYLSSYTWVMLVIHCLLRLQILPPIHLINVKESLGAPSVGQAPAGEMMSDEFGFSLENSTLPATLAECSVSELFKFFLFYYTTQIDLISDVITLRGHGEIQNKKIWKGKSRLWRLSIEDPFERADTPYPHDLGQPLRLDSQTKMFQVLSSAYQTMKEIEDYCQSEDFSTAGAVFYSLFEAKKPHSPVPAVPTGGMKKAKDKRKKKGSKASPAVAPVDPPKNLDVPPTSSPVDAVSALAPKKSQKRSKRNKKVPSLQSQK